MEDSFPHCDRCDCSFQDATALRRFISYHSVSDPPIGTYNVEPIEGSIAEIAAEMADMSMVDAEASVAQSGSLLLCPDCFKLWSNYLEARPLSEESVCARCPGEIPITGSDLWMVWYRAFEGVAAGNYVPVTPAEVARRYQRFAGDDVDRVPAEVEAEKLAKLRVVCLCGCCYHDWINDPADIPDI